MRSWLLKVLGLQPMTGNVQPPCPPPPIPPRKAFWTPCCINCVYSYAKSPYGLLECYKYKERASWAVKQDQLCGSDYNGFEPKEIPSL
jgi:hypothetical protein